MIALEEKINEVDEEITKLSNGSTQSNEWTLLNDMHLTIEELKAQLKEYHERQERNLGMKR